MFLNCVEKPLRSTQLSLARKSRGDAGHSFWASWTHAKQSFCIETLKQVVRRAMADVPKLACDLRLAANLVIIYKMADCTSPTTHECN